MDGAERLTGLMGLNVRAGKAVFGEDGCLKTIRGGKCALLLLDGEASDATREKYRGACAHAGVPLWELPPGTILQATGRHGVAMAVLPGGLAGQMLDLMPEHENELEPLKADKDSGGAIVR